MNQDTTIRAPQSLAELEELCAERPQETAEWFTANDYYGHATIIKKYCRLPQRFALPGIHPHGPSVTDNVWEAEVNHWLRHLLLVSEVQRPAFAKACAKKATVIGSPLYYAMRLMGEEVKELRGAATGTIVFPFHSTHHVTVRYNQDAFLEHLRRLPEEDKPITVCMYWKDVQLGRHRPFVEAGFECVSAGHIYDRDFIYRFIRIVASRGRCITNELGTCVFYSAALGLPVTIFRQEYALEGEDDRLVGDNLTRPNLPLALRFLEITARSRPERSDVAEQLRLAQAALGWESLWEADKLKSFLEELAVEQAKFNPKKRSWTERAVREMERFKRRIRRSK